MEGTAAGFVSIVVLVALLQQVVPASVVVLRVQSFQLVQYAASVVIASLLETFTKQIDNLFLPLYFYSTLLLMSPPQ